MTTMLEKAAYASFVNANLKASPERSDVEIATFWRVMDPARKAEWIDGTRAALMAIREPSAEMLRAAFVEMNQTPGRTWKQMKAENATPRQIFDAKGRPRFTAMIDEILNEKLESGT